MILEMANGILTLLIGVFGLKGISRRSPRKAKKMFKRAVALVVSIFIISFVLMIARFAMHREQNQPIDHVFEVDDNVFVEDDNIMYAEGDAIQVMGHIEYQDSGAVITIDMSWESEQAQYMDWSTFFYQLFEVGNDFAQSLPRGSTVTITIVDSNGAVYTIQGEKDWYEPPAEYSLMDEEEEQEEMDHHHKHGHEEKEQEEDEKEEHEEGENHLSPGRDDDDEEGEKSEPEEGMATLLSHSRDHRGHRRERGEHRGRDQEYESE